jgi:CheY-like chemotaxis protein
MTKKMVLIVDDNEAIIEIIRRLLKQYDPDIKIEIAHDGNTALQKAIELLPDLITLDISLPGIDGYEVCKSIKTNEQTKHIKILVVSGETITHAEPKILQLGADMFLAKPFKINDFLNKIEILLK